MQEERREALLVASLISRPQYELLLQRRAGSCTGLDVEGEQRRTFMISSGLSVPIPVIPIPAFAVPYAAPMAASVASRRVSQASRAS